jgi:hypothetical protein
MASSFAPGSGRVDRLIGHWSLAPAVWIKGDKDMAPSARKALASALLLNLVLLVLGRGSFGHWLLAVAAVVIGVALIVVGEAMPVLLASPAVRRAGRAGIAFGAILVSSVVSLAVGVFLNEREIAHAQHYCAALAPSLERFRQQNGRYPEDLTQVGVGGRPPWLLRGHDFYKAYNNGLGYRFDFIDPSSLLAGYTFDSRSGTWHRWD